ncbi:MAG: TIGR03790 family protein [Tepidisphaera sp.]
MAHGFGRAAVALALAAGGATALAGGAGENAILLIDPNDPVAVRLGHYYKNARQIPDRNVVYMSPGAADHAAFRTVNLPALSGYIESAGIADHSDYILIAPSTTFYVNAPGMISDTCAPVTRFSISSAYTTAFILDDFVNGGANQALPNRYYSTANSAVAFDSNTTWLSGGASTQPTARRYYIGGLIGYTGERGNTPEQIIAMIDRGTAVEGTRPSGTTYLMSNTADSLRNVRNTQFAAVRQTITNSLARPCEIIVGNLPVSAQDISGVMTGFSYATIAGSTMTLVPGAFCDHLTSFAAMFDNADQTKCSEWITEGASGTCGAVEEPCNYPGKFPHARLHVWYLQGASLGEAYLRSMQFVPFQNLLVGDALARPHAWIPEVSVGGLPSGPASGLIELEPSGTTAQPRATVASFDLLIDGVLHGSVAPGGRFSIDTTHLNDGWHDVRVLGHDSTPNRTVGRWRGSLVVDNRGRSAAISSARVSGNLNDGFPIRIEASGLLAREIQIVQNGRVLAAGGSGDTIVLPGRSLGSGTTTVHAKAIFVDGREALSPPLTLTVSTNAGSGSVAPTAFSYTKQGYPGRTLVVELPAGVTDETSQATYTITGLPTKATVIGGTGSYRILRPNAGASGTDSIGYRVTTPSGTSTGRVIIKWGESCPADFNGDAFVDFFDYDAFVACFTGQCDPGASSDFNDDGFTDFFDYDAFVEAFTAGC